MLPALYISTKHNCKDTKCFWNSKKNVGEGEPADGIGGHRRGLTPSPSPRGEGSGMGKGNSEFGVDSLQYFDFSRCSQPSARNYEGGGDGVDGRLL